MAKTIKRRIKKHRIRKFVILTLFPLAMMGSLASNLFLRNYQVSLEVATQNTQRQITAVTKENESKKMEIARLSNYDRVVAIAKENGFTLVQQNVITIQNNE
ncbi:MAG TPA: hypothetical protein DEA51_03120 [Erysipelotrichaceae bacterium]|nr:hypothetical protein [Erysipelotrichaceae bacterium]